MDTYSFACGHTAQCSDSFREKSGLSKCPACDFRDAVKSSEKFDWEMRLPDFTVVDGIDQTHLSRVIRARCYREFVGWQAMLAKDIAKGLLPEQLAMQVSVISDTIFFCCDPAEAQADMMLDARNWHYFAGEYGPARFERFFKLLLAQIWDMNAMRPLRSELDVDKALSLCREAKSSR